MLEQKKKGGDTGVKNISSRMTQHGDWRNQVTVALWMIALSLHLILMPMLIRELYRDFVQKKVNWANCPARVGPPCNMRNTAVKVTGHHWLSGLQAFYSLV